MASSQGNCTPLGLIARRGSLSGSAIGGINFCSAHNITADVEIIPIQKVNGACERLLKSDEKYRFCIEMGSLKAELRTRTPETSNCKRCKL
jgi:uncharacterized zinc-type alcohol dehydrogenase-like protein